MHGRPSPESANDEIGNLKAQIAELKMELDKTAKTTTQYLQNVAHQLTAPLNAIKWSIEAIKDDKVPISRKAKLLSSIYSQGTILVHLIKNFSLMSNLEADLELGQFREQPEAVDPLRLAINLSNDFQPQAAEQSKKIFVNEMSFENIFEKKQILVVKNLVAQALSNLLENAVKYSDFDSKILIAAAQEEIANSRAYGFTVSSTGLPISGQEAQKLTERGFRGGSARQKIPAGTGIGLYLAKRIMDLHKGVVLIRAQGKNSNISLLFPGSRIK
jgi:signal transduction histidine kinase